MMKRLALAAAVAAGLAGPAAAETIGFAEAIDVLARACGQDIERHCRNANLANNEIGNCLARSPVSRTCADTLVSVRASIAARMEAQATAERTCDRDIQRLCRLTKPGRGHILRCLLTAERSVSAACNAAITNAGWR